VGTAGFVVMLAVLDSHIVFASPSQQVPVGPRAIALGSAFTAIADDGTALFWNPAGLVRVGHQEVSGSYADLFHAGIRDNYASFVLPLSPEQAVAMGWYHSGFDDHELAFGENHVQLGYAARITPWLDAGASGKLVTQSIGLDGTSVRQGRGLGLNLGVMAAPFDRLRLGLVGQDVFGTRVDDGAGGSQLLYPRNFRVGAAYSLARWGTAAFDLDDRWHAGLEISPLEPLTLRGGMEDDRRGIEPATWTYGLGIKAGFVRFDYARVEHPTLESTDHFSVAAEFNFNPAQVRIERVEPRDLYMSLYKSYATQPFGTVQLRNLQERPLTARVSVFVPELMREPSAQDVILRPKSVQEVPLTAVFEEKVLAQRGDHPVQVQVQASYQSKRLARREKGAARCVAYAPGAIDWGQGAAQAVAFVTSADPAVDAVAREAARVASLQDVDPLGNRNLSYAAAMVDALAELGVAYVPDPNNPYSAIAETPHAVDTIHYPHQTLESRTGDCDDTTVLLASLLGNVGVPTMIVDAPGHVFLMAGTGLHERNRDALGVDSTLSTIVQEEVWIPIETTLIGKGFSEAWRVGAQEYASWSARGQLQLVDVAEAQSRYQPVVPPGERHPQSLDTGRLATRLAAEGDTISRWRDSYFAERFGSVAGEMVASAPALEEVGRVTYLGGDLAGARDVLGRAVRQAPQSVSAHNNLGVVLAGLDSLGAAEEHWRAALALGGRDPGLWLNLGLARFIQGDSLEAGPLLAQGIEGAGGYEAACRLLSLPPDESADRAGQARLSQAETRAMLRSALRRVPARTAAQRVPPAPPPISKPRQTRTAATRGASAEDLKPHWYWME
jgi:hypothetical protein